MTDWRGNQDEPMTPRQHRRRIESSLRRCKTSKMMLLKRWQWQGYALALLDTGQLASAEFEYFYETIAHWAFGDCRSRRRAPASLRYT